MKNKIWQAVQYTHTHTLTHACKKTKNEQSGEWWKNEVSSLNEKQKNMKTMCIEENKNKKKETRT